MREAALEVAILGGSFNPPHVGHLLAAQYVHASFPFDEVWLMPSFKHPFGKSLASFDHRLKMCQLLCDETSGWLKAVDVERHLPGDGRTVDTVAHLRAQHSSHKFSIIIGSDIVKDLPSWKDVDRLEQLARILVLYRAGYPSDRAVGPPLALVSSTEVRERLAKNDRPTELVPHKVLEYAVAHHLFER